MSVNQAHLLVLGHGLMEQAKALLVAANFQVRDMGPILTEKDNRYPYGHYKLVIEFQGREEKDSG